MVGFTRESAEAFRTTSASEVPDVKPPAAPGVRTTKASAAPRHPEVAAHHRDHAPVAHEPAKTSVVVRRGVNHWPRVLRNKWAGPLERVHLWWNAHFDRRHFPYFDNPPSAA